MDEVKRLEFRLGLGPVEILLAHCVPAEWYVAMGRE
jgi:hypothetical protein